MKYAIIVGGIVREPVSIATASEGAPFPWLKKFMPTVGDWVADPNEGGWKRVADDASPGDTYVGASPPYSTKPAIPTPVVVKRVCLTWEEFRKLFTDDELEGLDSYEDGTITLTTAQKRKIRTFVEKGKARGADRLIDVTTSGMASAIDYLVARGFVDGTGGTRKAEIIAGTVKS